MDVLDVAAKKTAKKTSRKKEVNLQDAFWEHLLEHGRQPASVFKFCKELGIKESDFYREYGSFDAIESEFWKSTVKSTIDLLESDPDTAEYDSRQLMLGFYFTYFESILDHRSRFLMRFPSLKGGSSSHLKGFRHAFDEFASRLIGMNRHNCWPSFPIQS